MSLSTFISRTKNYLYFKRKTHVFHGRKRAKRILYFGIPMHTNLGDQAQKYCIRKWLKENYPDFRQGDIKFLAYGKSIVNAMENAGLEIAMKAPSPEVPSVAKAIEVYLENNRQA